MDSNLIENSYALKIYEAINFTIIENIFFNNITIFNNSNLLLI